jgi:hypothetical protein
MKHLILLGLILGFIGCDANVGGSNSADDNSVNYIDNEQRDACRACAKTETLIEFGYEHVVCSAICPPDEIHGINLECDKECTAKREASREQALLDCRLSYECPE